MQTAALFIFFAGALAIVQYAAAGLIGTDGYYHVKIGYLMRTEGFKPVFDHLPFTILNQQAYYDHHYLYHAWLALFAWGDPLLDGGVALTQGGKLGSILLPAAAFTAMGRLLARQKVPYPFIWSLGLLAMSQPFLYRMSMARAQSLSLLLLIVAVQLLLEEKFRWLLVLGFVYVWSYNAFPLLLVVAGMFVLANWIIKGSIAWPAVLWPAAGIFLGLVINPYFPQNLTFIFEHLMPKIGESAVQVGNEWQAYRTSTLVKNSGFTFLFLFVAVLALAWSRERLDRRTLFALGLAAVFGYMLFQSRRFIEYFPPFVLLLTAFAATPLLEKWRSRRPQPLFSVGLLLVLLLPIWLTVTGAADLAANSQPADRFAAASLWLHKEAAGADVQIFQTDWDDFTRLFFYNSDARYTVGLDPTFMARYDPELFDLWVAITRGEIDDPGQTIQDVFTADYVFSDLNHRSFEKLAGEDRALVEVYRDVYAVIYRVEDS